MTKPVFYYGIKNREVDFTNPDTIKYNNGSIFLSTLYEAIKSDTWPVGHIYHCDIKTIPRARRLKEDSEPDENRMVQLMKLSPNFKRVIDTQFHGKEKIAISIMMSKSRTGAIVEAIRLAFYNATPKEFCEAMVKIGFDGYYGKFQPPANFHTDKEKFYYARLFNPDLIKVTKAEEVNDL